MVLCYFIRSQAQKRRRSIWSFDKMYDLHICVHAYTFLLLLIPYTLHILCFTISSMNAYSIHLCLLAREFFFNILPVLCALRSFHFFVYIYWCMAEILIWIITNIGHAHKMCVFCTLCIHVCLHNTRYVFMYVCITHVCIHVCLHNTRYVSMYVCITHVMYSCMFV